MDALPQLPGSTGVILGSSIPPTPSHRNGGLPLISSDGHQPSSPTPTNQNGSSSDPFNSSSFGGGAFDSSTFRITKTPAQDSATIHRPTNKRTNNAQNFLPATKVRRSIEPRDANEALELARNLLCTAADLEKDHQRKMAIHDLLTIHKDFIDGRPIARAIDMIANSVNHLEHTARKLTQVNSKSNTQRSTPSTYAQNNQQNNGLASSLFNNITNKTQDISSTLKPTPKQAQKATDQTRRARRLILIKNTENAFNNLNSLVLRNQINNKLQETLKAGPVIATITKSIVNNLVITTTPDFNAKFLLDNENTWKHFIDFKEAKEDKSYAKVIIHGLPLRDFGPEGGMDMLKNEVKTFNKELNLNIIGTPYWLTSKQKRENPDSFKGSAIVTFETEAQAQRAIRQRLMVAGFSARVEKLHSCSPTSQCTKCGRYGHVYNYCKKDDACLICAENHATPQHYCTICDVTGKACAHTTHRCTNCSGDHPAYSKTCPNKPTITHP
jgi:hypothetical protein